MPTGGKQHPISAKRVPLRDLPNETHNIITQPPGSSLLTKYRGIVKLSGTKRQQPDSSPDASTLQSSGDNGAKGHLMYVRRELETKPGKTSTCDNPESADSPDLKKYGDGAVKVPKVQKDQNQDHESNTLPVSETIPVASKTTSSEGLSLPDFVGKQVTGLTETEPVLLIADGIPQVNPRMSIDLDWRGRFLRLQMFLKSLDQSSQEDYIRKLRSLTAAGRSKLAVELEKRAIQLLLEEGKELRRMKVLNVLGNPLPKGNTLLTTPNAFAER